ncbi:hypothetical protein BDV09DRAFT_198415 [Aspergillus tetrazonus]
MKKRAEAFSVKVIHLKQRNLSEELAEGADLSEAALIEGFQSGKGFAARLNTLRKSLILALVCLKPQRDAYSAHGNLHARDNNYNGIVKSLLSREYPDTGMNGNTKASLPHPPFPNMHLFVASHNVETIQKA